MDKKDNRRKKIKLSEIKKIYKKPTLKYTIKVVSWIILLIVGFILNDIYDYYRTSPNIDLIMPETYNERGFYEFTFVNGFIDLKNITIKIQSPQMNETWKPYYLDDIPKNSQYILDFLDEKTIETAKKINCRDNPFDNLKNGRAKIVVYRNKTSGEFIVPSQNATFYTCTLNTWNIKFYSDKINKSFSKQIYMPANYFLEGIGTEKNVNLNSSDIEKIDEIILSMYDNRAIKFSEDATKN